MFVDQVTIEVEGGKGGNGIVAFRREYRVDKGGPYGGSGGRGGHIILIADEGMTTLLDFRYTPHIKGHNGTNGKNKGMTGAEATDTYLRVPLGTIIIDTKTKKVLADLTVNKQTYLVANGGRGGRGNMAFATGINKAPSICEKGEPGKKIQITLELKVLADCGLVGYPSVGKSTLISAISAARPKIAAYHFTTLNPNLGMVYLPDGRSFVVADLPGLIEGASLGLGLGIRFLKHIERCRVIVHIIDISQSERGDAYEDYCKIRNELKSYQEEIITRPEIIVCNKMDILGAEENYQKFKSHFPDDKIIIPISAYTKDNLEALIYKISEVLESTPIVIKEEVQPIYQLKESEPFFKLTVNNGVYELTGDPLYRLFSMTDFTKDEAVLRFARQLRSYKVDEALRDAGIKNGDLVRIFSYEFEFIE